MRTARLAWSWSAIVLMSGVGAGCAVATRSTPDGLVDGASLAQTTPEERRQQRDSAYAQAVADEVGPRVTVTADFQYAASNREVDAQFHMYDDAYVLVGHLDGGGRLKILFPAQPGDDGFVRGDKVYHIPSFFAGFADEYQWRYSEYRSMSHSIASRRDSYDAGLAYVFVIASWRPMRLDRVADGNNWATYDVADINYMHDPREAVEELAATIAGDNREAYTIEYAHYTTTNYGTYALSDFDAANGGCAGYRSTYAYGLSRIFFSPFAPFNSGFGSSCSGYSSFASGYPFGYGYGYGGYASGYPVAFVPAPLGIPGRIKGFGAAPQIPGLHLPHIETGPGAVALHGAGATAGSQYRRPGLFVEDAAGRRAPGERQTAGNDLGFKSSGRPTIQEMIGAHRAETEGRARATAREGMTGERMSPPRGFGSARSADSRSRGNNGNGAQSATTHSYGGTSHGAARGEGNGGATRNVSSPRGESSHPAPSRAGGQSAAHAAPSHSEPAARSAPAASSSGSGSKKP